MIKKKIKRTGYFLARDHKIYSALNLSMEEVKQEYVC